MIQQAFLKPCLVNWISKDIHLIFSIYITQRSMLYDKMYETCYSSLNYFIIILPKFNFKFLNSVREIGGANTPCMINLLIP